MVHDTRVLVHFAPAYMINRACIACCCIFYNNIILYSITLGCKYSDYFCDYTQHTLLLFTHTAAVTVVTKLLKVKIKLLFECVWTDVISIF
jgi:hypothetical protein